MTYTTGTISGYARRRDGTAISNPVYITASNRVYDTDGNVAIDKDTIKATPDPVTGFWRSPALPATDDTSLDPSGATYKVSVRGFPSVSGIAVFAGMDTEYATAAPHDAEAPAYAVNGVASVAGHTGVVTLEDLVDDLDLAQYVPHLPAAPSDHDATPAYVDTSTTPPTVKGWNGSAWVQIGGGGGGGGSGTVTSVAGVDPDGGGDVDAEELADALTDFLGGTSLGETVNTVAASGSAVTLPAPATATINEITLTANCAITVPTWTDDGKEYSILVSPRQRNTGGSYDYTVSWVGDIDWSEGGDEPLMPTGADAFMDVTLRSNNGGASWKASASVPNPGTQGYTLTIDGSGNVAIPADRGDVFDLLLDQDAHLSAPTGLYRNKMLMLRVMQDAAGGHELTYDPIFRFSSVRGEPFLSITGNKSDYLIGIYNTLFSKIDMLPAETGF